MWTVEPGEVTGDEPVTLDEAKSQCRVDGNESDVLLERLIKVAREVVEKRTGRVLRAQKLTFSIDGFGRPLSLPRAPINAILSISYTDHTGAAAILGADRYALRRPLGVPTLRLLGSSPVPSVHRDGDVVIEVEAGYANGEARRDGPRLGGGIGPAVVDIVVRPDCNRAGRTQDEHVEGVGHAACASSSARIAALVAAVRA